MLVRVRYLPARGMDHPYVVPLPTWSMVGYDPVAVTAVVYVPDEDVPPELANDPQQVVTNTPLGPVVHGASAGAQQAWAKHLKKRYQESPQTFAPELA